MGVGVLDEEGLDGEFAGLSEPHAEKASAWATTKAGATRNGFIFMVRIRSKRCATRIVPAAGRAADLRDESTRKRRDDSRFASRHFGTLERLLEVG